MSHLHHKVSALVDGELAPGARSRALAHVRRCDACRRELAETLEIKRRLSRLSPVEVSADLLEVVFGRVAGPSVDAARGPLAEPADDTLVRGRWTSLGRRVLVGAGSVSAVALALAYAVGAPATAQARSVDPPVEEFAADFADSTGIAPFADPAVEGLTANRATAVSSPLGRRGSGTTVLSDAIATRCAKASDSPQAVSALQAAVEAPQRIGYLGTQTVDTYNGSMMNSYRMFVQHDPDQGTSYDVSGADGVQVRSFVPASAADDNGLEQHPVGPLLAAFDVTLGPSAQVDGRPTTVVDACRHGELMAQFWIDDETGLLLRRTMYVDGRLVRATGFTTIETSTDTYIGAVPRKVQVPATTPLPASLADALSDKGWVCPNQLATEFHLSSLHQIDSDGGAMHVEYTDGLSTLSLFEERGTLDPGALLGFRHEISEGQPIYVREGLPTVAIWQSGDTVFTVVTDAPEQLTSQILTSLPHRGLPTTPGMSSRIGDGFSKLVSAVSP